MKKIVKHNTFSKLLLFSLVLSPKILLAEEIKCLKTSVIRGSHCNNLLISFDFTECGIEGLSVKEVRSKCVNQKAVSFVRNENTLYVATYGAPLTDSPAENSQWRFLSVRKEEKKDLSQPSGMSVSIKKLPKTTSGIVAEELPQSETIAKVVVAPEASAMTAQAVSLPAESMKTEIFPKVEVEKQEKKQEAISEVKPEPIKSEEKQDIKAEAKVEPKTEPKLEAKLEPRLETPKNTEEKKSESYPLKFSGFIDLYYLYNFNGPTVATGAASGNQYIAPANNPYRMFDMYHDNFSLSLAQVSLKKEAGKMGGRLDLGFGPATSVFSPLDGATQNVIQANIYYKFSERVKLTAGKMISHMGLEDPYAIENMNYSRSLLFTYGIPLWHSGVSLETQLIPKKLAMTFYSYNAWSGVYNSNRKTGGVRLSYSHPDLWTLNYNYISHTQDNSQHQIRQIHELNYSRKISDRVNLAMDSIWGYETRAFASNGVDAIWNAVSLGVQWKKEKYIFSPRIEYFYDPQGYAIDGLMGANLNPSYIGQNIMSYTLTNTWLLDEGGKFIFELRQESSDRDVFRDSSNAPAQSQTTGTLGFIFEF